MKQIQTAKRPRGSAGGRLEPLPVDPATRTSCTLTGSPAAAAVPRGRPPRKLQAPLPELTHAAHRLTLR